MSDRTAMWLLTCFFGVLAAGVLFLPRGAPPSHGRRLPEQRLFMSHALSAMEDYRRKSGAYPSSWFDLDHFTYGCERGYELTDPAVRPPLADRWRPKDCTFTYVIKDATRDSVVVQAVDDNGVVRYEIEPGMRWPREVDGGSAN